MILLNKVYGVIFNELDKRFYFVFDNDLNIGDYVIVNNERGEQLVKVVDVLIKEDISDYESIVRVATDQEYEQYLDNLKNSQCALKKCREFVKELELDMNVVSAQFNLDKSQLLFNFTADGRVDFRELAKKLASIYHTRIELRQIGARDKAREIGGIGVCGGELCCLRFLKKIDTISMNMAKNQNLALNPSKINGACGRLLCCLAYEDETYIEQAKKLPKVGDTINTLNGEAQVLSVDIINCKGKILLNGEKVDYEFTCKE